MVNQPHYQRIKGLLDAAIADGANVLEGGASDDKQRYIAPTLIDNMSDNSSIMQEENFGAVLPNCHWHGQLDEAISYINNKPKPLALYVFSSDKKRIKKILQETGAGDTCVNTTVIHYVHHNLPFGGVNISGIGKSGGYWGFRLFS